MPMRESFTITNLDPVGYRFIRRFSAISFMFVCIIVMIAGKVYMPGNYWKIPVALLFLGLGIILPLVSARVAKAQVQFDGMYISHRCPLRYIKIDLRKVKRVGYRYESVNESAYDAVYLDFLFDDDNTITFTDAVPKEAESLVKGSHTGVPLLLLYDDIICTFPDKAGRP